MRHILWVFALAVGTTTSLAGPASDAGLEQAVRAAYSGAAAFATAHGNYFTRDGVLVPLRDAIRAELLEEGLGQVSVADAPFAGLKAASACLKSPGTELRIITTDYGDGIGLVAVSDTRVFAYRYDPRVSADIAVIPAADCVAG